VLNWYIFGTFGPRKIWQPCLSYLTVETIGRKFLEFRGKKKILLQETDDDVGDEYLLLCFASWARSQSYGFGTYNYYKASVVAEIVDRFSK
jgi:hypothetical protein